MINSEMNLSEIDSLSVKLRKAIDSKELQNTLIEHFQANNAHFTIVVVDFIGQMTSIATKDENMRFATLIYELVRLSSWLVMRALLSNICFGHVIGILQKESQVLGYPKPQQWRGLPKRTQVIKLDGVMVNYAITCRKKLQVFEYYANFHAKDKDLFYQVKQIPNQQILGLVKTKYYEAFKATNINVFDDKPSFFLPKAVIEEQIRSKEAQTARVARVSKYTKRKSVDKDTSSKNKKIKKER